MQRLVVLLDGMHKLSVLELCTDVADAQLSFHAAVGQNLC